MHHVYLAGPAAVAVTRALARELADSCSHAAHTYLHAQQLLGLLGTHPRAASFVRLGQEVEGAAAVGHAGGVWATVVRG